MPTIIDTIADEVETVVDDQDSSMEIDQHTEKIVHVTRERSTTFRAALAQLGQSGREEALSFAFVLERINQVPSLFFFCFVCFAFACPFFVFDEILFDTEFLGGRAAFLRGGGRGHPGGVAKREQDLFGRRADFLLVTGSFGVFSDQVFFMFCCCVSLC